MAHAYQLRCLGGPSLLSASGEQVRFRTRKHLALLVRLALEPGKRFTRDYLTDLLWPSAAPRLANHSLAQGLSVIKAKVAREAVLIQRATVGLAPGWVDVDAHHLNDGLVNVEGAFLDGFEIPGARPFEEWKDECRARLLPQIRDCLVRHMDAARRIGDFPAVERHAAQLQNLDPLAEEAIRGIMEARAWAADRSNALKAFARYEAQLAEELGAKPGADLVRMADLLRDGRRSGPRPLPAASAAPQPVARRFEPETLIGREREFSVLYDAWIEARRKTPRIVVVTSDPGVGKTTLANAFVSSCQMDGAVVARTQAYDAERELPFAVLGELVRQLAAQRAIGSADPEALSELTRITAEITQQFLGRRLTDVTLYAAVDLSPGLAAEASSRLKDEGLLREVRGELEFRNELIRAQAYYAVAGPARQHLHRRVGELLEARGAGDDKALSLEIAWHYLRGGEGARAVPFAHEGANAFLAVGAPREGEEILKALRSAGPPVGYQTELLLAKTLVGQSKADEALPFLGHLAREERLTACERAEVARLRASAEFSLNREPGEDYCKTATRALELARESGDNELIVRALFEIARAGTEAGLPYLVRNARDELDLLSRKASLDSFPMAGLTKAFCSFFFQDAAASLDQLQRVVASGTVRNRADLGFVYAGLGIAHQFQCQFAESHTAIKRSLEFWRGVGDDARAATAAANLCNVQVIRGCYDDAIQWGEWSARVGEAADSSSLLTSYTNLMDAYVLANRGTDAVRCLDAARRWLVPTRRWKLRCAYHVEAAAFALTQGNMSLALNTIEELERLALDREEAVPMPGPFWKLKLFRAAHLGGADKALSVAASLGEQFKKTCPYHYLDILAVRAWLERQHAGGVSESTTRELGFFDKVGAPGKKALLTAQGFLTPGPLS